MAFYRSTGTYVDEVPPFGANVVDGMWIFRVKRPPGSPVFKARYVAKGFNQREGVDFFQTFAPTPKMTTLRVLLHVAARRDYELHSIDFSTAFLQGSLHEEWHDTLRSTLYDLGFQPSSVDPSLFFRRGSTPFFVMVYVDDLVFATTGRVALADVKLELQKRHSCTNLGELHHYLGLQITRDRAACTITLSQSHMVQQVLQRFELEHSTVHRTPFAVDHRLTGPFPDEPFEPSGPYAELVGCLMYLLTCTRPDLAFPLCILARFVAPGRHRPVHRTAAVRVAKYLAMTSGVGLVLGGRQDVMLIGHCDSSYADDAETHMSTQGYCFGLGSGAVSWRSTRSSSVSTSTAEAEIYAGAMAAQELCWPTFLLTDLSERLSSTPTLFTDNKATILLCQEPGVDRLVSTLLSPRPTLQTSSPRPCRLLCFFVTGLVTVHFCVVIKKVNDVALTVVSSNTTWTNRTLSEAERAKLGGKLTPKGKKGKKPPPPPPLYYNYVTSGTWLNASTLKADNGQTYKELMDALLVAPTMNSARVYTKWFKNCAAS
ncbi:unnamed protein product [Closterium sp. NIES-53]